MKMKLKKTLRAVSAAAVGAGAIMVLGLAGQSLALAQSYPTFDGVDNGASDDAAFRADIGVLCGIAAASQPFGGAASDPDWNCGDKTRTYP